jgi:hypothetical protein
MAVAPIPSSTSTQHVRGATHLDGHSLKSLPSGTTTTWQLGQKGEKLLQKQLFCRVHARHRTQKVLVCGMSNIASGSGRALPTIGR